MQPHASVTDEMREQLLDVVKGRAALGRPWNDDERGHAHRLMGVFKFTI